MLVLEALVVCQVSVVDWPLTITVGFAVREAVGASGEVFTVTAALACAVPPAPFAVSLYVTEEAGVTCREPLAETVPSPSMLTLEALVVCHVSVTDWPLSIDAGMAVRVAVGTAGGSGGGSLLLAPPPQATKGTESKTTKAHRHRNFASQTCKPIHPPLAVRLWEGIVT